MIWSIDGRPGVRARRVRPVRHCNRGLLFGPREAGCWEFLVFQAFSCGLVASVLGWATGNRTSRHLAGYFWAEGIAIVLLLTSVAQSRWLEERFPRFPQSWIRYSVLVALWLLVTGGVCRNFPLLQLALGFLATMLGLLLFSVLLRLVLSRPDP